jgi:hypothetical protein
MARPTRARKMSSISRRIKKITLPKPARMAS